MLRRTLPAPCAPTRAPLSSPPEHVRSHHITSRYITSCHITSHHVTSHHGASHHVTSHHVTSQTSHHVTSHHVASHHVASCRIMSHSHHVTVRFGLRLVTQHSLHGLVTQHSLHTQPQLRLGLVGTGLAHAQITCCLACSAFANATCIGIGSIGHYCANVWSEWLRLPAGPQRRSHSLANFVE